MVYSFQVSVSSDLNQKIFWKICLLDHVFSQALPVYLVGLATMNDLPQVFNFERIPICVIVLKVRKFGEDRLTLSYPGGGG